MRITLDIPDGIICGFFNCLEIGKPFTDWDLEDCESYEVTHWQPMPHPPKGE